MKNFPLFSFLKTYVKEAPAIDPQTNVQTNVAQHHRQTVQKRNKYRCLVCQSNWATIDVISNRINSHPRLTNPNYGMLVTADIDDIRCFALEADILLLSLDDNPHAIEALLELPELGTKMIVIMTNN